MSPASTVRSTSSTARTPPYALTRPRTSTGALDNDVFGDVAARDAEEDDRGEDQAEEDDARCGRSDTEPAVGLRLRELVADRGAEWSRQDVGDPEGRHGIEPQPVVRDGRCSDRACEEDD